MYDFTETDIIDCINETSELAAKTQANAISTALVGAHSAGALANEVEFFKWIGQNYKCLSTTQGLQTAALNNPQWLQRTVLQGKGYEWDFMVSQRGALKNLFSRFDGGTSATQVGIDITETNILNGAVKNTFQNKAITSTDTAIHLQNTPKDVPVVTNKEAVTRVQKMGYDTVEFQDTATIKKHTSDRFEKAKSGNASGQYTFKNVAGTMAKAGLIGAAVGIGIETVTSFKKWKSGDTSTEQYLTEIGKSGAMGGINGAATAGIMIPIQAAITAAGASSLIGIPISILIGSAIDKIIAPAFGRGDYAKLLSEAKYYQSLTDMEIPLIQALEASAAQFGSFIDEINRQREEFVQTTAVNQQMNILQQKANQKLLESSQGLNDINAYIRKI